MLTQKNKEVRYSVAQQALVTVEKIRVRGIFIISNVLLLVMVFYTTHRFPGKYVRVNGECDSNWLHILATEDFYEIICCDEKKGYTTIPCYSGMDLAPILGSMQGAWVIPLSSLVINYVSMMLGPNTTITRVRIYIRRALLYLAMMVLRTVVLYGIFGQIEKAIVYLLYGSSDTCWYAHLRRNNRCVGHFDHSDHLVLLVSHYVAISIFEWFTIAIEMPVRSVKKVALQLWILLIVSVAIYTLFFTASFFHTAMENLVALLIAQACVMLPLYLISQDYFSSIKWLQLKNFVLPPDDLKIR